MDLRDIEVTVKFTVKREHVPGLFFDPQDFADSTANDVLFRLSAYNPVILEKSTKDVGDAPLTEVEMRRAFGLVDNLPL